MDDTPQLFMRRWARTPGHDDNVPSAFQEIASQQIELAMTESTGGFFASPRGNVSALLGVVKITLSKFLRLPCTNSGHAPPARHGRGFRDLFHPGPRAI